MYSEEELEELIAIKERIIEYLLNYLRIDDPVVVMEIEERNRFEKKLHELKRKREIVYRHISVEEK